MDLGSSVEGPFNDGIDCLLDQQACWRAYPTLFMHKQQPPLKSGATSFKPQASSSKQQAERKKC